MKATNPNRATIIFFFSRHFISAHAGLCEITIFDFEHPLPFFTSVDSVYYNRLVCLVDTAYSFIIILYYKTKSSQAIEQTKYDFLACFHKGSSSLLSHRQHSDKQKLLLCRTLLLLLLLWNIWLNIMLDVVFIKIFFIC